MPFFSRPTIASIAVVLVLGAYTWRTHRAVHVWESNLTLWANAVVCAPLKPRPALNYGAYLGGNGQFHTGVAWMQRAYALATDPRVHPLEREDVRHVAVRNGFVLLAAGGGP